MTLLNGIILFDSCTYALAAWRGRNAQKSPLLTLLTAVTFLGCGSSDAQEMREPVKEIIANVRANEELYKNLEIVHSSQYSLKRGNSPTVRSDAFLSCQRTLRCVFQDNLMYQFTTERGATLDKTVFEHSALRAYDGEYTRSVRDKTLANKVKGRRDPSNLFLPHTWLLFRGRFSVPLSVWLGGGKQLQNHPKAGKWANVVLKTRFEGEEQVNGLPCVKLRCESWSQGDKSTAARDVWLATTRNYLPAKQVAFAFGYSKDLPLEEDVVQEYREIASGVWFPMRTKSTVYDEAIIREEKKLVVSNVEEIAVQKAVLDPKYDVKFFRGVEFPPGAAVYEVDGKKIVNSYIQPGVRRSSRSGWWWLVWPIVGALVVGSAYWFSRWRRHRNRPA